MPLPPPPPNLINNSNKNDNQHPIGLLELHAELERGVYLINDTIRCTIKYRNCDSKNRHQIGWSCVQINCYWPAIVAAAASSHQTNSTNSIGGGIGKFLLLPNDPSKITSFNASALHLSSTQVSQNFNSNLHVTTNNSQMNTQTLMFSTKPNILFCDLWLEPSETKTFKFSDTIPSHAPPSYKGINLRYTYAICIGTQLINCPVQFLRLPLRIMTTGLPIANPSNVVTTCEKARRMKNSHDKNGGKNNLASSLSLSMIESSSVDSGTSMTLSTATTSNPTNTPNNTNVSNSKDNFNNSLSSVSENGSPSSSCCSSLAGSKRTTTNLRSENNEIRNEINYQNTEFANSYPSIASSSLSVVNSKFVKVPGSANIANSIANLSLNINSATNIDKANITPCSDNNAKSENVSNNNRKDNVKLEDVKKCDKFTYSDEKSIKSDLNSIKTTNDVNANSESTDESDMANNLSDNQENKTSKSPDNDLVSSNKSKFKIDMSNMDECKSNKSSHDIDDVNNNDDLINMTINLIDDITSRRTLNTYSIGSQKGRVARFTLLKANYKLGDDIIGLFDFTDCTQPCVQYSVTLQSEEVITKRGLTILNNCAISNNNFNGTKINGGSNDGANRSLTNYSNFSEFCLDICQTQMILSIPLTVTPSFHTDVASLNWQLHFEFVTAKRDDVLKNGRCIRDKHGHVRMSPNELNVTTMVWDLPIQIYTAHPQIISEFLRPSLKGSIALL